MAFPCSLDTKMMSEYVTRHFAWDRRGIAFPPSSLRKDFQTLCPGFELAEVEEAGEYYELPKLPEVIFYVMLLNEAERIGVMQGQTLRSLESALTELCWSAFESDRSTKLDSVQRAVWERIQEPVSRKRVGSGNGEVVENIGRASSIPISLFSVAFPPIYNTRETADYVRGSFIWRWRSASCPPRLLPEDFHVLCPRFSLFEAEGTSPDFELPKIVQVIFYAMLLNEVVELGVAHDFTVESMKSSLIGLRWSTFEIWMDCVDHALRGA
ncbi:hypothetical protein Cgig2_003850 [Carnegiea gigantea]|uniref:Uncharacterized protein n=1 Tax=Carnegiea gigantea TaxID=171969 RepID=A0A9Q1GW69_9CARY|nr:hypothetical protein Cgig2_003850 [Carnegiea gigantea]